MNCTSELDPMDWKVSCEMFIHLLRHVILLNISSSLARVFLCTTSFLTSFLIYRFYSQIICIKLDAPTSHQTASHIEIGWQWYACTICEYHSKWQQVSHFLSYFMCVSAYACANANLNEHSEWNEKCLKFFSNESTKIIDADVTESFRMPTIMTMSMLMMTSKKCEFLLNL